MERSLSPTPKIPEGVTLNPREAQSLVFFANKNEVPLASVTAVKLFELYLNGKSCEEIRRIHVGFNLGQIVDARIRYGWDKIRDEKLQGMIDGARYQIQKSTLETTLLMCDLLTAKNKLIKDRIAMYIETGDEAHLVGLDLDGIKGYKSLVETLQKLTGQDKQKVVTGEINHTHTAAPALIKPVSSEQADEILGSIVG